MNFTRKLTVAALSVSMLLSIPAFGVTVEPTKAQNPVKNVELAAPGRIGVQAADALLDAYIAKYKAYKSGAKVNGKKVSMTMGDFNALQTELAKFDCVVTYDETKAYNLDIKKTNKGYIYNSSSVVLAKDKKKADVKHLQQVMPKSYGVSADNIVGEDFAPATSSWMPSTKTLAIGAGTVASAVAFVAAYKYSNSFAGLVDGGFAKGKNGISSAASWLDGLTGNRVSGSFAYSADKMSAGKNWMMDTRAVKAAGSLKDSIAGYASALKNPFSMPSMDSVKSWVPYFGAKTVAEVVDTTAETTFDRLNS